MVLIEAKLHRMHIHKEPNIYKRIGNILAMEKHIAEKHNIDLGENEPCPEEIDTLNATYYGYIYIGTPPQRVRVAFDTGHNIIAVKSSQYNASLSSTKLDALESYYSLELPFAYHDADYATTTTIYSDVVTVSDLIINQQTVAVFDADFNEYGFFGLAINGTNTEAFFPALKNMQYEGLISQALFSMYLVSEPSPSTPEYAGEVIFGSSDPTLYQGQLNYIDMITMDNENYAFNIDLVAISGKSIATQTSAVIDSGADLIGSPVLPYALINAQLNGTVDAFGHYFVDCNEVDALPIVEFSISGQTISLSSSSYILNILGDNGEIQCMSAFYYTNTDYWILGSSFMLNYYYEFDISNNRIGWAPTTPYSGSTAVNIPAAPALPLPKRICKSS